MLPWRSFAPIGVAHTPFPDKVSAPRQPAAALDVTGTIELFPGHDFEHALEDLEGWERIWVIFCFHLNEGWRPKVLPPRSSGARRGVFSTRSPHRPNPIGMSVLRLDGVEGRVVRVRDVDLVDGTPVLDIKPYVPYADAFPRSRTGWLAPLSPPSEGAERDHDHAPLEGPAAAADPEPGFQVVWSDRAAAQASWLREAHGVELGAKVDATLGLGPQPHPYRRIRREGDRLRLAVKDWRVYFRVEGRVVTVLEIGSGYRVKELESSIEEAVALQRAFVAKFR